MNKMQSVASSSHNCVEHSNADNEEAVVLQLVSTGRSPGLA